ncbi:MAG: Gldg family protein [Candidatus Cloacimonetes bacterium]|nr:Gldg family protein [Candidatus Cloacimonadota bacterium]
MKAIKDKQSLISNIVIFAAIIIFVNLISINLFKRLDFSDGKVYSLSESSKKVIRELDDRLVAKAYFSKNLPGQYADTQRYARDLLAEYEAYARGRFHFEFVSEENVKEEARKNMIQPVKLQVVENDKIEVREVYMGIAFFYQDKNEVIPIVQNTRGLEYDITSSIKKITAIGLSRVAFFQGEEDKQIDPRSPQTEYQELRQMISSNYEMMPTDLESPLDSDVSVLLFTGVKDSLTVTQLYNLDQYLMNGGNLVVFQDKVDTNLQEGRADLIQSNIFPILENYGIYVKNNLVQDAECSQVSVQQRQGIFVMNIPVKYPFFPISNNMNKNHPIVANLDNLVFVFVSEIDAERVKQGVNFEPLIYSSKNSGQNIGRFDLSYEKYMKTDLKTLFKESPKVLAGMYSGHFESYFTDNEQAQNENYIPSTDNAKILLVADADFIKASAGGGSPTNVNFAMNAMDYLSGNEELVSLRSRETEYRPLKELENHTRKLVKWLNILVPAALLIIFGIIRYKMILAKRQMVGKIYE